MCSLELVWLWHYVETFYSFFLSFFYFISLLIVAFCWNILLLRLLSILPPLRHLPIKVSATANSQSFTSHRCVIIIATIIIVFEAPMIFSHTSGLCLVDWWTLSSVLIFIEKRLGLILSFFAGLGDQFKMQNSFQRTWFLLHVGCD